MAILKPEGRYLDSNYDHLKPEGLAGQCLNSNYGYLKPEGLGSAWRSLLLSYYGTRKVRLETFSCYGTKKIAIWIDLYGTLVN